MVRRGLIAALFTVLVPAAAAAQIGEYSGLVTAFLGGARGGDVRDRGWTPGASVAVVDESTRLGVELDLSQVLEFDKTRFAESGVTTLTVNVQGLFTRATSFVRPYAVGGVGFMRVRGCVIDCNITLAETDAAFDLGAGAFVLFNGYIGARGDIRYFRFFKRQGDLPLVDEGHFDFWRISVGGTFAWPIR